MMFIVLHREISHTSKLDCILFSFNLFLLLIILFSLISANAKKVTQELSHD